MWEIGIKYGIGKLTLSLPYGQWIVKVIGDLKMRVLPITMGHVDRQVSLPLHHRDPFDRLLAAQALVEGVVVVSNDVVFDLYGVTRIWK